jgi:hypothetical protein
LGEDLFYRFPGKTPGMIIVYVMNTYGYAPKTADHRELMRYPKTREPIKTSSKSSR